MLFLLFVYVTASKVILLSWSVQKISTRYLRSGRFRKPIMDMLEAIIKDMATRFHKVEFHHLFSEASALDPIFKKKRPFQMIMQQMKPSRDSKMPLGE